MSGPQMRSRFTSPLPLRISAASLAFSVAIGGCSSSDDKDGQSRDASSSASLDAEVRTDGAIKRPDAGDLGSISVGKDSPACNAGLAFHPPGCACTGNQDTAACFSGKLGNRNRGGCKDGVQHCTLQGEFRAWGECEGEVTDCGPDDAGPPEECGCIPGSKILCSEDCAQLIICSLTGTKTCGPDGKWGPCTEQFLAGLDGVTACKNLYYQCLAKNSEGLYVGDCDQSFTCGHPPGLLPPDAQDAGVDAGVDAGPPPVL